MVKFGLPNKAVRSTKSLCWTPCMRAYDGLTDCLERPLILAREDFHTVLVKHFSNKDSPDKIGRDKVKRFIALAELGDPSGERTMANTDYRKVSKREGDEAWRL